MSLISKIKNIFTSRNELHFAIYEKDYDKCENLIKYGFDVNYISDLAPYYFISQKTPLILAATSDLAPYYFISQKTPLILAATMGNYDICKLLIDNGADVNFRTKFGYFPLYAAICNDNYDICKLLIANGAVVNFTYSRVKTNNLNTALLHIAVRRGNYNICKLLLDSGANINIVNDLNEKSIDQAIKQRDIKIVKLLIDYGSYIDNILKKNIIDKDIYNLIENETIKQNKFIRAKHLILYTKI
jgi:ankyrin repeat protein